MKHESKYLLERRNRMWGLTGPAPKKTVKPIAKKSASLKREHKIYLPAVKKFLSENKECKIKMEGCTTKAVCVHHAAGRIGHKLHDQEDWVPACTNCNLKVEINNLEARSKGFVKTRMK